MPALNAITSKVEIRLRGLQIENLSDDEIVHQRALLVRGRYIESPITTEAKFVSVYVIDKLGRATFPEQTWPEEEGRFKAIVLLSPGENILVVDRGSGNDAGHVIRYLPLLQTPPLHLAIMVAKDSPLIIDCPPAKHGPISSAHSSLDAAIAKFRMTAYQWQAMTAEDMRAKGLGRRAFRLDEEWSVDTTSRRFLQNRDEVALHKSGAMRSTAKIHLIRSDRTVEELRDAQVAQQNEHAHSKDKLFDYFLDALKKHGSPFESYAHPIVAGMILDSHYSLSQDLIVGHAALGCHNPQGISLGMFGSHLTYSWPRFLEEVSSCLLDTGNPGDTVGNDCGECCTLWEACSIGQGAFLHEVGHAFGAPHTTGIMARGYAQDWPKNFLPRTAYCAHTKKEGFLIIDGKTKNNACWDLSDTLSFRMLPHFWLPGDDQPDNRAKSAVPSIMATIKGGQEGISIHSGYGIVRIKFNDIAEENPSVSTPKYEMFITNKTLERYSKPTSNLKLQVLGMNGKERTIKNVWALFRKPIYIRIPDSKIILGKQSVTSKDLEEGDSDKKFWEWATLLTNKTTAGKIERVSAVTICTGCILDGAYVHFGSRRVNCGPRVDQFGQEKCFGGHASEDIKIPTDQDIVKIEVSRQDYILRGLRMHLGNGETGGALSGTGDLPEVCTLVPPHGYRVVGFFGRSYFKEFSDGLVEFGIITAPYGVELPPAVYSMRELQNTDGGEDVRGEMQGP